MRIKSTECWVERLPLKPEFQTLEESQDPYWINVFMKINTEEGLTGWGMAAPDEVITGEDEHSILQTHKQFIDPILKGENPFYYSRLYEFLREQIPGQASALAMMEIALYDLMAQKAGVPLFMLLGGFRKKILTSVTIDIIPDADISRRVSGLLENGVRSLKVKGGKDVERDIRIIGLIREKAGDDVTISFDANQGYSLIEAAHFIRHTRQARLSLIEQPTSPDLTFQWHLLRQEGNIPIMADESLKKLSDAFSLVSRGSVDYLNVKLMKVGGITPTLQINSSARSASVNCMMGCMNESSLGIAAGLHVALARPNISHADLDSWLYLTEDPFAGLVQLKDGYLHPTGLPGLGMKPA